jgi:hypothetical protein
MIGMINKIFDMRNEDLWEPESPGMRVNVTRSRFGRWFKPTDFATLRECVERYDV